MEKTVWLNSYNSELFKLRKRPAVWVVFGVWLALMLVFTYVFPYLGYRAAPGSATGRALLTNVLPQQLAGQAITGYPVWGGALIVVLGALALGSEYGWGTMRTMLSNRPSRMTVYTAQMAALFTSLAALVVIAFLCSALASELISVSAKGAFAGVALGSVAKSIGAGWLILCMWCTFGAALGIALRGTALSIGLGLVWFLVVENVLRAVASIIGAIGAIEKGLPGVNAGSLVAGLGGATARTSGDGVVAIVGGSQALAVVVLFLLVFGVAGGSLLIRRDVH
jgi:ABC-2 type transport system permease protein